MKIGVTSPLYINNDNHLEFVHRTTKSIKSQQHQVVWLPVENFVAGHYRPLQYQFVQQPNETYIQEGGDPQGVAKGWNLGIKKGIEVGCDYVLVVNDDIVLKYNAIDRLVAFAEEHPDFVMWSMGQTDNLFNIDSCEEDENWSEHPNFSAYMIRKDFFDQVGTFDETFTPAYYEDNDMHARIALANKIAVVYGGARFFHFGSRTVNADALLKVEMPPMFRKNAQHFVEKWGRSPAGEPAEMRGTYFPTPYNDPTKTIKDW
jgi:GT2 family glycosyltransferase